MYYYQFNIGDYLTHTSHLTLEEDAIYRRLLDLYYLNEKPFTGTPEHIARLIRCNGRSTDVEQMLNEFFLVGDDGAWHNKRADNEIEHFSSKSSKASSAGKKSAESRAKTKQTLNERSTDVEQTLNERSTNQEPVTNNQEPVTNNQEPVNSKDLSAPSAQTGKKGTSLPADWKLSKEWGDWALSEKPEWTADDVRRVAEDFKDHWLSNANQAKSKKADWFATWRKWVRSPLNEIKPKSAKNKHDALVESNKASLAEWLQVGERVINEYAG